MTRILFMSDTHLDVRRPHQVVRQRKIEFQDVFAQIIDYALENEVDLICHSGDLYDLKRPSPVEVQKTIEQLLKLKEKDIKFYVIRGNHDGSADLDDIFGGWSGEYIKTPQLSNVELIDPRYDEARKLDTVGYRDFSNEIRVYGVGYFRQETQEKLKQYIPLESVDSSRYNILLMHGFVSTVNDDPLSSKNDFLMNPDIIKGLNMDVVALGHSHHFIKQEQISNTWFVSPGSPIDWDFGKSGSLGFYTLEVEGKKKVPNFQFHHVETKYIMKSIVVDGKDKPRMKDWYEKELKRSLAAITQATKKELLLHVKFKGTYHDNSPRLNVNRLRDAIHEVLGSSLLYLGNIGLKGLQYSSKQEIDIESLREIKLDEDRILEILNASVEQDLGQIILSMYKEIDNAYGDPKNLTSKKNELKGDLQEGLNNKIESKIKEYYRSKITDKELDKISIESLNKGGK